MTRPILQLLVAFGLVAASFVSWRMAGTTGERASRAARLLTLQELDEYWAGKYDAVTERASADEPPSLVAAANASFRKAQRDTAGVLTVERLDQTLQAYASALKNGGFNRDAAFNFEYVARLRDAIAKAPRRPSPPATRAAPSPADDLPIGPTLHGRPGMHPPATRGEEFEVLTPMDYGERETRPEATPGRPLPRKG